MRHKLVKLASQEQDWDLDAWNLVGKHSWAGEVHAAVGATKNKGAATRGGCSVRTALMLSHLLLRMYGSTGPKGRTMGSTWVAISATDTNVFSSTRPHSRSGASAASAMATAPPRLRPNITTLELVEQTHRSCASAAASKRKAGATALCHYSHVNV